MMQLHLKGLGHEQSNARKADAFDWLCKQNKTITKDSVTVKFRLHIELPSFPINLLSLIKQAKEQQNEK